MKQTNKHSSFAKISALKAAEEQFEYNQQLLRATIDSSMDMIQVFKAVRNEQNEIVDFTWILNNATSEQYYGDVIGKSLDRESGSNEDGIFDTFKKVTESGVPDQSVYHYVHEQFNGWFLQSTFKQDDGVTTTTKDITGIKNAENELKEKNELLVRSHSIFMMRYN